MGVYEDLCRLVDMKFPPMEGVDAVCPQMIRHWCEAMQEDNPLYLDEDYGRRSKYGSIICPPAMTPSWVIPPLWPPSGLPPIYEKLFGICGLGGYGQVIDTENEMHFLGPLLPGDRVQSSTKISKVSSVKTTTLGEGFFVTLESDFVNQRHESVCRQRMTMYMYRGHGAKPSSIQPSFAESDLTTWHSARDSNSPWNIGASATGGLLPGKPRDWKDVKPGDQLPVRSRLMTTTTIIAAAIASRDFAPLHHDVRAARNAGVRDIFLNYLTSGGLVAKYLTDWSRPGGELRHIRFNLMTPCCAGDSVTFRGTVREKSVVEEEPCVNVVFSMSVGDSTHCRGEALIALPHVSE